jgi:hypothetical protein
MDINAAVREHAGIAVDPADAGGSGDYAFKAFWS